MPVTLALEGHLSPYWKWQDENVKTTSSEHLFHKSCRAESHECQKIIQSSLSSEDFCEKYISSSANGLVWAAIDAYSDHYHLIIRPEDAWFAILSQLSFYINANSDRLRDYFVSHQGQKELTVRDVGTIDSIDFGSIARQMTDLIQENIKEPRLQEWIMPSFSTTTACDRTIAAILMMGSMQKYFSFHAHSKCGLPSVRLLGEREDWENILTRLEYLSELGSEPQTFATLLKPVFRNFVASFDSQLSASTKQFWQKIAHRSGGSGPKNISGWITAFCFWNEDGKMFYNKNCAVDASDSGCELDGVNYHRVMMDKIPAGFASVPLTVNDNGKFYRTKMMAGSFGIESKLDELENLYDEKDVDNQNPEGESTTKAQARSADWNTIQPLSGWVMYELGDD